MKGIMTIAGSTLSNVSKNTMISMTMTNGYAALAFVGGVVALTGAAVAVYAIASNAKKDDKTML